MNDQKVNLKLVWEVEKHAVLYNFTLPGYSRKDETEAAWSEIGKALNMTKAECKEKWKNIRAVFVRNMKPSKSGSGTKPKKAYYLSDAMQFTVPYIKALGVPSGNVPITPQNEESEQSEDKHDGNNTIGELSSETPVSFLQTTPSLPPQPTPTPPPTTTEMSQQGETIIQKPSQPSPLSIRKKK